MGNGQKSWQLRVDSRQIDYEGMRLQSTPADAEVILNLCKGKSPLPLTHVPQVSIFGIHFLSGGKRQLWILWIPGRGRKENLG